MASPDQISPTAIARRERNREDDGQFGKSAVPERPKLKAGGGNGLFSPRARKERARERLNPKNMTLDELMKQTTALQFSPRDNLMRGVWEILRSDSDDATMVPLLWGLSGTGKTSSIKNYVRQYGGRVFHVNCANLQVGETEGIPYVSRYETTEDGALVWVDDHADGREAGRTGIRKAGFVWLLEPIEYARANPDSYAILFLDELNRASQATMNEMMTFISERTINGEKLPDNMRLIAACNPSIDDAVQSLSAAQRARFVHLQWPDGEPHEAHRDNYGWPVMKPTEYVAVDRDGNEKTAEHMDEFNDRLLDLRIEFLSANPVYFADRGIDTSDYTERHVDEAEAAKSQLDSEYAYGTERAWTEAMSVLGNQLLHIPAWSKDKHGHSVEDSTPGSRDIGLAEKILAGYVGEKAAREFMIYMDNMDLPNTAEWLSDPDGQVIKKLPTADRAALMAQSMARGLITGIEEATTAGGVERAADMLRSWVLFLEAHSTGSSTNRPFVLSKLTEAVDRAAQQHKTQLTKVFAEVGDPNSEWYKEHRDPVVELLGYVQQGRTARRSVASGEDDLFTD